MASIDLPLQTGAPGGCALVLLNSTSVWGGPERWIELELRNDLLPQHHAPCAQPLTCFHSVLGGRQTAMLCQGGMLSLKREGALICVEYHGPSSLSISGTVSVAALQSALETLAQS